MWKTSSVLHGVLTPTSLNTFGMNLNAKCLPGSSHDLRSVLDLIKSLVAECANPHSHATKSCRKAVQKRGNYYNSKEGLNLQWGAQKAHLGMMVRKHKPLVIWYFVFFAVKEKRLETSDVIVAIVTFLLLFKKFFISV